jgi:glycosyltransferase involved in cell wall biosynthesis
MTIKVAMLDSTVRIRNTKEIIAMKEVYGDEVDFIFIKTTPKPGHQHKIPGLKVIWLDPKMTPMQKHLEDFCKQFNIDLLHTHNYPDTYGQWGINIREKLGIPVVHECHDIGYHYATSEQNHVSKVVMNGVDKIISVSQGMTDYLHKQYGINENKCTIIYPYANRKFIPTKMSTLSSGCNRLVYQGGVSLINNETGKYNHRFYKNIFTSLSRQKLRLDVYPAHPEMKPGNYGAFVIKRHIPDISNLYHTLSLYDFGFVGYHKTQSAVMDLAMPNKLFEYIACGLPILAMDYKLISEFVKVNNFGAVISKSNLILPREFKKIMINAKMNVLKRRSEFIMENQIHKLKEVYESVLK